VLTALCQDTVTAKRNLQRYGTLDTTFPSTREAKFCTVLTDAVENGDPETFTGAVVEFDQVMRLDNWKTGMLLKVKRSIGEVDLT
jgi:alpha-soluble NSF attachment protein